MKKYIKALLCVMLCVVLFGCSAVVETDESTTSATTEYVSETVTSTTVDETTEPDVTTEANQTEKSETTQSNTRQESTQTQRWDISNIFSFLFGSGAKNSEKQTTTVATHSDTTKSSVTTTVSTCTIDIECKQILSHMDNLAEGHESLIPPDGILLSTYTVELKGGESAYDVLKKACDANGIYIYTKSTVYGIYVAGLNNIDEKDCGPNSGWLYYVNGSPPSKACSAYTVSAGDRINFRYTCG